MQKWTLIVLIAFFSIAAITNPGDEKHQRAVVKFVSKNMGEFDVMGDGSVSAIVARKITSQYYTFFSQTTVRNGGKIIGIGAFGYVYLFADMLPYLGGDDDDERQTGSTPARQDNTGTVKGRSFIDIRDGKVYKIVKIGSQTWLAENMHYVARGSKCYGNIEGNCAKYGRLYNWETAFMACPEGTHLPTDKEWTALTDYVGGSSTAGKKLKSKKGWKDKGNGTDEYEFSALAGGGGGSDGNFHYAGDGGYWWSATENDADDAIGLYIGHNNKSVFRVDFIKNTLFSVRCVLGVDEAQERRKEAQRNEYERARQEAERARQEAERLEAEQQEKMEAERQAEVIKALAVLAARVSIGTFTDSRDGKSYRKVAIGTQTWMAENLNFAAKGSVCYENKDANCAKYGRLYDWATVQKVCPAGFHLPSTREWTTWEDYAGGEETAGKKLKLMAGWNENGNGTDDFGWSALPGGFDNGGGRFYGAGNEGVWWSASEFTTECDADAAIGRSIYYDGDRVSWSSLDKTGLFSVRCVEGASNTNSAQSAAKVSAEECSFLVLDKIKTPPLIIFSSDVEENEDYASGIYGEAGNEILLFIDSQTKDSILVVLVFGETYREMYKFTFNKTLKNAEETFCRYAGLLRAEEISHVEKKTLKTSKEAEEDLKKAFSEARRVMYQELRK
jgi:uncharacterized protein (TIGR02145 family)